MQIELQFLDFLQTLHTPLLNAIMIFFTRVGDHGVLWIALTVAFLILPKHRKTGICIIIAVALEVLLNNFGLKLLVQRVRPYDVREGITLLIERQSDFSFPSGHTGSSFAFVTPLFLRKNKLRVPCLIVALLIAFSRLYLYVHFPTDVLAGAILGIVCGVIACFIVSWFEKRKKKEVL